MNIKEYKESRPYQQCTMSVMDTIADPDITFDKKGICNYYYEYKKAEKEQGLTGEEGRKRQEYWANEIKKTSSKKGYNCIVGISGGADSTYLAYLAKKLGLKALLVHFDYGWNTDSATRNVQNIVKNTGFDLYTVVMDWPEMKSLQRSYFQASVLDLDIPADHMIFGALYQTAHKFGIKHLLSGNNVWTEHTLPKSWNYNKFDLVNMRGIHKAFENTKLKKLPALGLWQHSYFQLFRSINRVEFLNWQEYNSEDILKINEKEMGWHNYGTKHQETVFTRFYQGFILPKKYGIDKRKAHLSNRIFAGHITKEFALKELEQPPYNERQQQEDFEFVAKKLGFSFQEFEEILNRPNVPHEFYGTDEKQRALYFKIMKTIKPVTRIIKKFTK